MPSEVRQEKGKLKMAQKCSILGPQNLHAGWMAFPGSPHGENRFYIEICRIPLGKLAKYGNILVITLKALC